METFTTLLPCPTAFFSPNGHFLGCTHSSYNSYAMQIVKQCLAAPDYCHETAASYHAEYALLNDTKNEPLCIVLLMDALGRKDLLEPVRTLLLLNLRTQELQSQLMPDSDNRVSFIYQLLSARNIKSDMLRTRAIQLHYTIDIPRTAVLFSVDPSTDSEDMVLTDFSSGEGQRIFLKTLKNTPGHCSDDIGEFMNLNSFSLLKTIPEEEIEHQKQYLTNFIQQVIDTMENICGLRLHVCVGSCYYNLLELHSSYEEALFLSYNYDFFASDKNQILFIGNHVYDYLVSLLPEDYYKEKFHSLTHFTEDTPALKQTLVSLSQHNINLRACASAMNLHRNTMLQRYEKIKKQLSIDPATNNRERINLRQYSLYCHKKLTLRVGVIIQSSNVLNLLYRKLGEQLYRNSDGEMDLEIQTLGVSGNNRLLFDLLSSGELDMAVGNPDSLISLVGEQISVLNAPFLFDSSDQALSLLNGKVGQMLLEPLSKHGFINLAVWSMGWRYFSYPSTFSIKQPQDLKGRRIRIMQKPLIAEWLRFLGAVPCLISYDKILSALDEGLVEMQENPYHNFYEMQFYRYQQNVLELDMLFDSNLMMTTVHAWERLSPQKQEIVRRSVDATTQWNRELFVPITTNCRKKILEKGVHIYRPTPEEEFLWRQASTSFLSQSSYADTVARIEQTKNLNREYNK